MSKPDPSQLTHLLALLHDESDLVRDSVLGKLAEFGSALEEELRRMPHPLSEPHIRELQEAIHRHSAKVQEFYQERSLGTVLRTVLFQPGDRVLHRRYGYRGLVVDRDLTCEASPEWYNRNQTRPEQQQPWYHVLVHGSDAVTYAAQTSLLPEDSDEPIQHVLVPHFFHSSGEGGYIRNANPWPPTGP